MIKKLDPDTFAKGIMVLAIFGGGILVGAAFGGIEPFRQWISALSGWYAGGAALWIGLTQIRPLLEQISISSREEARQSLGELTQLETSLEFTVLNVTRATDPLTNTDQIIGASLQIDGTQDLMHNTLIAKKNALQDTIVQAKIDLKTAQIPPVHFKVFNGRRKEILRALSELSNSARRMEDFSTKVISNYSFHAELPDLAIANKKFVEAMNSRAGLERQSNLQNRLDNLSIMIGRTQSEIRSVIENTAEKHHISPSADD
ncbi:hypothetical protein FIV00_15005 [Labrenzia sp. THAF82]|uniref:hypothetical protein n=1 Tax=Labrenzia sp. THAF82 TaxID=2587861 RepID=UPI0012687F93|nr:hypothetical protein [Labrenzia sp. THAF82]QFT31799.1 hypothetical protein FIV00_15005 [Labrenzia sp. THAF82]